MEKDLMIACSGSGETKITTHLAQSAKESGGRLAVVTANPNSTLGKMTDLIVLVPCGALGPNKKWTRSIQLGRALFEQGTFILFDAMILRLAERLGASAREVLMRHTNLE
jgi:6-phospho-3-hexuloisomerase